MITLLSCIPQRNNNSIHVCNMRCTCKSANFITRSRVLLLLLLWTHGANGTDPATKKTTTDQDGGRFGAEKNRIVAPRVAYIYLGVEIRTMFRACDGGGFFSLLFFSFFYVQYTYIVYLNIYISVWNGARGLSTASFIIFPGPGARTMCTLVCVCVCV